MSAMLEELAEVVRLFGKLPDDGHVSVTMYSDAVKAEIAASNFIRAHHATIAQNAEDSKRLKALEQAMDEIGTTGISDADQINIRADEIMRGGE